MTSKKTKKGKTIPLTDFLANESKLVTVRGGTWADIVDKEEAETKPIGKNHRCQEFFLMVLIVSILVVDIGGLPTAPRAAMDVDYSTVPEKGPFVAYIANLSFEIDDEGLRRIFADLKVRHFFIDRRQKNNNDRTNLSSSLDKISTSAARWNS